MDAALATSPATRSRASCSSTSRPMWVSFRLMLALSWLATMRVENFVVELGALASFIGIGDVLAQIVDADAHARAVNGLSNANGVGDFRARHEAAGNPAADRGALGKSTQRTIFGKADKERPQHEVPARCGKIRKEMRVTCRKTTEICITTGDCGPQVGIRGDVGKRPSALIIEMGIFRQSYAALFTDRSKTFPQALA